MYVLSAITTHFFCDLCSIRIYSHLVRKLSATALGSLKPKSVKHHTKFIGKQSMKQAIKKRRLIKNKKIRLKSPWAMRYISIPCDSDCFFSVLVLLMLGLGDVAITVAVIADFIFYLEVFYCIQHITFKRFILYLSIRFFF